MAKDDATATALLQKSQQKRTNLDLKSVTDISDERTERERQESVQKYAAERSMEESMLLQQEAKKEAFEQNYSPDFGPSTPPKQALPATPSAEFPTEEAPMSPMSSAFRNAEILLATPTGLSPEPRLTPEGTSPPAITLSAHDVQEDRSTGAEGGPTRAGPRTDKPSAGFTTPSSARSVSPKRVAASARVHEASPEI